MRISIVTDTIAPDLNGVAMSLERFCDGLLQRGHGIQLVSPVKDGGESLAANPAFWRYRTDRVPFPGYPGLKLGVPTTRLIKKLWKDNRPDIVYIATEAAMGVTSLRVARKRKIPAVSGFHTNFHSYSKDYRLPFLEDVATGYLRHFHNESDATFAPAEDVAAKLRDLKFKRVGILGRGIDTGLFHPGRRSEKLRESWGASPTDPVALYVGRIALEKNLKLFFEACDKARETTPNLRVVLVGDGPVRETLQEQHPEAIFAGIQRAEDLAVHYASADLFPFPSMSETYGNVVVEALASGLQVIAFDYAAPAKFLKDRDNGYLIDFSDSEAFIKATSFAVTDPQASAVRESAVDAASDHSWESIVEGFEQDLEKIIANYKPRGALAIDLEFKPPWMREKDGK